MSFTFDQHWMEEEMAALKKAESFNEAAEIALIILGRMKQSSDVIVQICGPMTTGGLGNLEDNMALFALAVETASANGLTVFNQGVFQDAMVRIYPFQPDKPYPMHLLEEFYRKIFESKHISKLIFLPSWHTSIGTKWEREIAPVLGMETEDYPAKWLGAYCDLARKLRLKRETIKYYGREL